ncbi:MAG: biopolymer transporter ExbD [Planctomycetes bacterium]|nr:biopolymer transporter ExbD [Planctomycetota bacterium]
MNAPRRFQLDDGPTEEPTMLMTSMIDVIFILLACFIGVSELKKGAVKVDVPQVPESDLGAEEEGELIVIEVGADASVYVAGERARDEAHLEQLLTAAAKSASENATVHLRGDRSVNFERMVQIFTQLSRVGFERVQFAVEEG